MIPAEDQQVIVLDAEGRAVGRASKLAAHQPPGTRHLAFSVLLSANDGRLLLQRRAATKHHFANRWANTCCSHPQPGETVRAAAARRLREELGVQVSELIPWGAFWYRAEDPDSGLVEIEYDVVLVGRLDPTQPLSPDPDEVAEVAWYSPEAANRFAREPRRSAPWLRHVLRAVAEPPRSIAAAVPL